MRKKVCHCAHCVCEADCAANDWFLADEFDPCCPNMKSLREQIKREYELYMMDQKLGW